MKNVGSAMNVKGQALLDVSLWRLVLCKNLEGSGQFFVCPTKTGKTSLLSGEGCPDRTGYNGFEHGRRSNPGYFMLVARVENTSL